MALPLRLKVMLSGYGSLAFLLYTTIIIILRRDFRPSGLSQNTIIMDRNHPQVTENKKSNLHMSGKTSSVSADTMLSKRHRNRYIKLRYSAELQKEKNILRYIDCSNYTIECGSSMLSALN